MFPFFTFFRRFLMLLGETRTAKMLNLVWLNLASRINLIFLLRGKGLNCALLCSCEAKPTQNFLWERKGILLTKRRPFLSQALSNPTARERLLRYAQFYPVLSRRKCKFDIFKMWVSVAQICKFNFKFERKTIRRSIFSLDETEMSRARARINNT